MGFKPSRPAKFKVCGEDEGVKESVKLGCLMLLDPFYTFGKQQNNNDRTKKGIGRRTQ